MRHRTPWNDIQSLYYARVNMFEEQTTPCRDSGNQKMLSPSNSHIIFFACLHPIQRIHSDDEVDRCVTTNEMTTIKKRIAWVTRNNPNRINEHLNVIKVDYNHNPQRRVESVLFCSLWHGVTIKRTKWKCLCKHYTATANHNESLHNITMKLSNTSFHLHSTIDWSNCFVRGKRDGVVGFFFRWRIIAINVTFL